MSYTPGIFGVVEVVGWNVEDEGVERWEGVEINGIL
jgi:hypothetical protein